MANPYYSPGLKHERGAGKPEYPRSLPSAGLYGLDMLSETGMTWVLLIVLIGYGYKGTAVISTTAVPGFSSLESCARARDALEKKYPGDYIKAEASCIKVN